MDIRNVVPDPDQPVEQAWAYRELLELNGWTALQLAAAISVSKSSVTKALALLRLREEIRAKVDEGAIPATAAYELARLDREEDQCAIASRIADKGLSREQAVALVRHTSGREPRAGRRRKVVRPEEPASPPPCPPVPISDRYAFEIDDHAVLVYGLERGIKLTLTTPRGATGMDLIRALGSTLEDARPRLANMADSTRLLAALHRWPRGRSQGHSRGARELG